MKIKYVFMALFLTGCTMGLEELDKSEVARRKEQLQLSSMTRRFVSIQQIQEGMTRKEVKNIIGHPVVVGYELVDSDSGQYKPLTVDNPYRTQVYQKGSQQYDVDFYLVGIKKPDNQVTDDELIPLIFYKDKLIGKGWDDLEQAVPQ